MIFAHVAITCKDPIAVERFYTKYFGFQRARVIDLGEGNQIVFIKLGDMYLELFGGAEDRTGDAPANDGYPNVGWRHIAFKVDSVDDKLAEMGGDAKITQGPMDFDAFIPGWRTVWVADPEGNIVEITQGYTDQDNPPALD
ncbi:MAG: VOC family protein [Chloroflexi bacterium]|nr:VOC family protein [Chloroflexota bacterium]